MRGTDGVVDGGKRLTDAGHVAMKVQRQFQPTEILEIAAFPLA